MTWVFPQPLGNGVHATAPATREAPNGGCIQSLGLYWAAGWY